MSATSAQSTSALPTRARAKAAPNLQRASRYFSALLTAIASYWAYRLLVVPFIEPPAPAPAPIAPRGSATTQLSQLDLSQHFPPGAWQLDAKVLETKEGVLVFGDELKEGNRLTLKPMALLLLGEKAPQGVRPRPVILEAPEGAELVTDESGSGASQYFGKPVAGLLKGEITIRRAAGPRDDNSLRITTRQVQIEDGRIWTPHEVRFAFGSHWGVGQDLEIQLAREEEDASEERVESGAQEGAAEDESLPIRSLRLATLNKLMAYVESKAPPATQRSTLGGQPRAGPHRPASAASTARATLARLTPVEITCKGPFLLDVESQVGTLRENVRVKMSPPGASPTVLSCDRIELHFQQQAESVGTTAPGGATPLQSYQLTRLTAVGAPVRVDSDDRETAGTAGELNYDFRTRRISLSGDAPVELRHSGSRVVASRIDYQLHAEGMKRIGHLWAAGPGRIDAVMGDSKRPVSASWRRLLRIQPQGEKHVVSLFDDVLLEFRSSPRRDAEPPSRRASASGLRDMQFRARELHMYLLRAPEPATAPLGKTKTRFFPDSLLAKGNVRIDSTILTARTGEVQLWFRPLVTAPGTQQNEAGVGAAGQPHRLRSTTETGQPAQRHTAVGQLVQARLRYDPAFQVTLDDIQVQGDVDFRSDGPRGAMRVTGDSMHLQGGDPGAAVAHLHGRPARLEARGSWIAANSLLIDQAANRIAADGGGGTLGLVDPAQSGAKTQVTWQGPMIFDGATARFQHQVEIRGEGFSKDGTRHRFHGAADDLHITLLQPLRLTELEQFDQMAKQTIELGTLRLTNRVFFQSSSFQGGRQQSSELSSSMLACNTSIQAGS